MATQGKARSKTTRKEAPKSTGRATIDARGLNPKQARFVDEYLIDLNGTQAAIRAGYSAKTAEQQATRLLRNAQISAAVDAGKAERSEKVGVTAKYVLENLQEVVERCMQRAPVLGPFGAQAVDDEGRAVWKFDAKGSIGALELLGKHLGLFVDRVKLENPEEVARAIAAAQSAIDTSGAFPAPPAVGKAA